MKLTFDKYHGTGNDFILIDNRSYGWKPDEEQVAFLCDRHFGIGADGLILLSEKEGYHFQMNYYNSDGRESTMCGNGGRSISSFAKNLGLIDKEANFFAFDGPHQALILSHEPGSSLVRLKMNDVRVEEIHADHIYLNTGSPHYVTFTRNAAGLDIMTAARNIRYNERFHDEGTNVDFVEIRKDCLFVRTYERGVEDETLSCGTGVTASALAWAMKCPENQGFFNVKTKGGDLIVWFEQDHSAFTNIWLEGPVKFVFRGELEL